MDDLPITFSLNPLGLPLILWILQKRKKGGRVDFVIAGKKTAAWFWGKGPVIVLVHVGAAKAFIIVSS